jgi:abortive infection alpha-like protein
MTDDVELVRYHAPREDSAVEMLAGLARLAAHAWLRSAIWSLGTSVRLARATLDPQEATRLAREVGDGLRGHARNILGVAELDDRIRSLVPTPPQGRDGGDGESAEMSAEALRAYGADLLRRSADVEAHDDSHPAYARILEQLAPDEARILRLLATQGDQPAVDIRSSPLLGLGSQLVAEGLNMIGAEAGVRQVERVPAYLNNLYRLGLIWFSKEPIEDPVRYQVLEAQPDVLGAIKTSGRAKSIQRSIRLTPFGQDFCVACLPLEG